MKHLIFYIWAYPQIRKNPLYWVHIRCLSKYISIFNDVSFYIALNEYNDTSLYRNIINDINTECSINSSIAFYKLQNDFFYREAKTVYEELFIKLNDYDGITMFGHMKGLRNTVSDDLVLSEERFTLKNISCWVCGMYYSLLNNVDFVCDKLLWERYATYGTYANISPNGIQYCGSFYWINSKKLLNYIHKNNKQIPELCDRTYAESVFQDIMGYDGNINYCHNNVYFCTTPNLYMAPFENSEMTFGDDYPNFLKFYNEMTKGLINE